MYRNKNRTLKIMKVALLYCAMTKNCGGTVSLLEKILGVGIALLFLITLWGILPFQCHFQGLDP